MQQITLTANGLSHPALKMGDGPRLALMLHGFPDTPHTWAKLMPRLAVAGYTCIAPWLRGYTQKNTPDTLVRSNTATVQIADLAEDIVALVDSANFSEALLIGHDWGAIAAYAAANHSPHKFSHLVTLSVPHLRTFLSNLWKNPRQLMQSWYILFFQLRFGIPEGRIAADHLAFIDSLWKAWSPNIPQDHEALKAVKEVFSDPEILSHALAYYRGMLSPFVSEFGRFNESRKLSFGKVSVPTLTMTGSADGCIIPEMFEGMHQVIGAEFVLRILPLAGHFLPIESDERIAQEIFKFCHSTLEVKHA